MVKACVQAAAEEEKRRKSATLKGKKASGSSESPAEQEAAEAQDGGETKAEGPDSATKASALPSQAEQIELIKKMRGTRLCEESRKTAMQKDHKFWATQPVPQMGSAFPEETESGQIDEPKTVADVRAEGYGLPNGFEWVDCDIMDDGEAHEIYQLLTNNYVEDDDNMFRFDYAIPFLRWALTVPGFHKSWHVGVRMGPNKKLVGFISGIPAEMVVYGKKVKTAEINFLCVHKKLRSNRLAPVLIKEVTRRVNLLDIWQAVYTAGVVLPRPVAECRYYHRSLNPKKLIEVGFSHLGPRMTMARTVKLYKLPEQPEIPGIVPLERKHMPEVFKLVSEYLKKFKLHPHFTQEELAHWIVPQENVVYAYVVVSQSGSNKGRVTDVCSFYSLPSSILGHEKHTYLKAAYSYWNVATSVSLEKLMNDALILAKQNDFDVFNALDVMENEEFLKPLKFGIGDGFLQYYLYNWQCPHIDPAGVGLVLL